MSIEKIERALRDGLEGVTPGPWGVYAEPDVGMFGDVFAGKLGDDDFGPIWNRTCNLEHIARCSPENIRALLDELARLRRLEHAVQFTAKMAWREDPPNANQKLTDEERLSAIKWHPTIKDLGQAFLSEREGQE